MSTLFNLLTSPFGFPTTPVWSWLLSLIIGGIVHEIAWQVSPGGRFGSLIYWFTKLLAFIVVWAIMNGIIQIGRFVVGHWIWFIVGLLVIVAIILAWLAAQKYEGEDKNDKNKR